MSFVDTNKKYIVSNAHILIMEVQVQTQQQLFHYNSKVKYII